MIAAATAPRAFHTVMVAWKDAREAARALTAAMPLLSDAKRVVVAAVVEGQPCANTAAIVASQLAWHGIRRRGTICKGGWPSSCDIIGDRRPHLRCQSPGDG